MTRMNRVAAFGIPAALAAVSLAAFGLAEGDGRFDVRPLAVREAFPAFDADAVDEAESALIPPIYEGVPPDEEPGILAAVVANGEYGFQAFSATGWNPPDPDLAVGADHIVAVVNVDIRIFDKNGTMLLGQTIRNFFNTQTKPVPFNLVSGDFIFDPVALHDPHSGRYAVAAAEHKGGNRADSRLLIGVSQGPDPMAGWYVYEYDMVDGVAPDTGNFLDFENLGIAKLATGEHVLSLAADYFGNPGGNWMHFFDMAQLMAGVKSPMTVKYTSTTQVSLGATLNYDANSPAVYFARMNGSYGNKILVQAVTDPLGTPVLTGFNVPVTSSQQPPGAAQMGTSNLADTIDRRIKNGIMRNGALWCCGTIGQSATARTRWYEITTGAWPASGTPALVQEGVVDLGPGVHNWQADLAVSDDGSMAMSFHRSSASEYIGIWRTFRTASDPLGVMRTPVLLKASTSPETGDRWGDYTGMHEDPDCPGSFWSHGQFRNTGWKTWAAHFTDGRLKLSQGVLAGGQPFTMTVRGAHPGETVLFYSSTTGGNGTQCFFNGTLCVDLEPPYDDMGSAVADEDGVATLTVPIPAWVPPGIPFWTQAYAIRAPNGTNSLKSNVAAGVTQ